MNWLLIGAIMWAPMLIAVWRHFRNPDRPVGCRDCGHETGLNRRRTHCDETEDDNGWSSTRCHCDNGYHWNFRTAQPST